MVSGSRRGLLIPTRWWEMPGPVYLPEGPTGVAALLANTCCAIGRPTAHQHPYLATLLRSVPERQIIVYGDNDVAGRKGAERCVDDLRKALHRPVDVIFPPPEFKDVREQLRSLSGAAK